MFGVHKLLQTTALAVCILGPVGFAALRRVPLISRRDLLNRAGMGIGSLALGSVIQIYSGGTENEKSWDGHTDIRDNHSNFPSEVDQPIAALLSDLRSRGLLDSTLVICGGEFGRTSDSQGSQGRDHNPNAFTTWFAGGGIRGGVHYGATDEFGYKAVDRRVTVHDLHATILHLLGMNHEQLTYRFNGRDYRLTDVYGNVLREILA